VAKTVALDARALAWARRQFARYYGDAEIEPPFRFARREFAAFPFAAETMMRRHDAFRTAEEFRAWLPREVPRHVYYSTAYYRKPAEPTMAAKEWLGADLIFDLDSDHLRGAETLRYAEQLALVKTKLRELVDDFLFGDFGIDPRDAALVFSGGRGYHVHVRNDAFLSLTSPERRELVDYLVGSGFDPDRAITERSAEGPSSWTPSEGDPGEAPGAGRRRGKMRQLAPPDAPGWRGRMTRAVLDLLAHWETIGSKEAAQEIAALGIPPPRSRRLAKMFVDEGGSRRIRTSLSLDVFERDLPKEFWDAVLARAAIRVEGETDAPVTTDIHRLIRLPRSLHGGTGFRVLPLTRTTLDEFDPFRDAPVPSKGEERQRVTFTAPVDYPFPEGVRGEPGATEELLTPTALFLLLRGEAELPP
jgi:DNA primase small subunit